MRHMPITATRFDAAADLFDAAFIAMPDASAMAMPLRYATRGCYVTILLC